MFVNGLLPWLRITTPHANISLLRKVRQRNKLELRSLVAVEGHRSVNKNKKLCVSCNKCKNHQHPNNACNITQHVALLSHARQRKPGGFPSACGCARPLYRRSWRMYVLPVIGQHNGMAFLLLSTWYNVAAFILDS